MAGSMAQPPRPDSAYTDAQAVFPISGTEAPSLSPSLSLKQGGGGGGGGFSPVCSNLDPARTNHIQHSTRLQHCSKAYGLLHSCIQHGSAPRQATATSNIFRKALRCSRTNDGHSCRGVCYPQKNDIHKFCSSVLGGLLSSRNLVAAIFSGGSAPSQHSCWHSGA